MDDIHEVNAVTPEVLPPDLGQVMERVQQLLLHANY